MAFWGIEVKPGKPFTHLVDELRGRLHISQATLAHGDTKKTILVQCNVGKKSPVYLCALLPDKTESVQLNLEFDEADEVVFSVLGPRGVHLTGYYLGNSRHSNLADDSESYGEDIANTDSEGSIPRSEEDEYEDSFIDDDEPEVLPLALVSSDGDGEVADVNKLRQKKHTNKRLKKKYKAVESVDDTGSWQLNSEKSIRRVLESDGEDSLPISFVKEKKEAEKNIVLYAERDIVNKGGVDTGTGMVEENDGHAKSKNDDAYVAASKGDMKTILIEDQPKRITEDISQQHEAKTKKSGQVLVVKNEYDQDVGTNNELSPENSIKSKKQRKERSKERIDNGNHINSIEENNSQQVNTKIDNVDHDLLERSECDRRPTNNMEIDVSPASLLHSTVVSYENTPQKKRRRKEKSVGKSHYANGVSGNVPCEGRAKLDGMKTNSMENDLHEKNEQEGKPSNDKKNDIVAESIADENIDDKKIKKKKKSKSKNRVDDEIVNVNSPNLAKEEKEGSMKEFVDKNVDTGSAQTRTLSNGLTIEDLELGKSDGKTAALGKKLKVRFTTKLKESGQIIDSNIGTSPFRFRLGDPQIVEGWNAGLDGMRVGGKRRLVIPPSLCCGSQGTMENVPPNSWLVYDIELMSVH